MAQYTAIPEPTTDPASLRDSVLALKQAFEILSGQRKNQGVAAVTNDTLATATAKTNSAIAATNSAAAANAAAITALQSGTVTSIAGNSGAITLNAASGITNAGNDVVLSQASSSQFGAVKVDGTSITAVGGVISASGAVLSKSTSSLSADVALNVVGNYFNGPSLTLGPGIWFVTSTVTVIDTGATAAIYCKLWDGTTVIASAAGYSSNLARGVAVSLSGYITVAVSATVRVSCRDPDAATGKILFNQTGNSKDSTITAIRIG